VTVRKKTHGAQAVGLALEAAAIPFPYFLVLIGVIGVIWGGFDAGDAAPFLAR
jgi:hypothetical protein